MDDYKVVLYIVMALIYFLTRGKKKKPESSRPGTENNPPQEQPKTFEELLKEITGEAEPEAPEPEKQTPVKEPEPPSEEEMKEKRLMGERRAFADDESRRIYEESIKQAEGFDIEYGPDEHFKKPGLFRNQEDEEEEEYTFADEIRDGLSGDDVKKAIIYSEILTKKY